ncbi:MAG TPA: hypothetical protein VMN36_03885 [Verrucomicrobiales bacterium]|nr:hypothetical protein [Verrucomicrobiales bacterium]
MESPSPVLRTNVDIRYVAEPKHVREVSLIGASDFGFWSDYLRADGLEPVRCGDVAQVVVVAAEMVYLGVRFAEVSFSVRASLPQDSSSAGLRLIHAFTSSRVFAWCERTLFATPYFHGECQFSVHSPASIRVKTRGGDVVGAEMSAQQRLALRARDEHLELPVFLPPRGAASDQRLFFARVRG